MLHAQLSHTDNLIRQVVHGLGKRAPAGTTVAVPAKIDVRTCLVDDPGAEIRISF